MVTLIASTNGNENCGKEISRKSKLKYPVLSVIKAIWSPALHSGTNGLVFKIHIIFVTSLSIFNTHSIAQNNFGNFGGGGKFGNSIFGNDGRSGKSANSILGNNGRVGRFILIFGLFDK